MTELARPVAVDRIGPAGLDVVVEAEPAELAPAARRLMIPAVNRLRCSFRLRRQAGAAIEASGELRAEVVQTCVVSLDDFPQEVHEAFAVRFVPEGASPADDDPDSPDEIPYAGAALDLGEAALEQLALALDPYPRKPDAEPPGEVGETSGPFAALAALRRLQ